MDILAASSIHNWGKHARAHVHYSSVIDITCRMHVMDGAYLQRQERKQMRKITFDTLNELSRLSTNIKLCDNNIQ